MTSKDSVDLPVSEPVGETIARVVSISAIDPTDQELGLPPEVLADLRAHFLVEPDELTARRHLGRILAARDELTKTAAVAQPRRRVWATAAVASAISLFGTAGMAAAGVLPEPMQNLAADVVAPIGVDLPRKGPIAAGEPSPGSSTGTGRQTDPSPTTPNPDRAPDLTGPASSGSPSTTTPPVTVPAEPSPTVPDPMSPTPTTSIGGTPEGGDGADSSSAQPGDGAASTGNPGHGNNDGQGNGNAGDKGGGDSDKGEQDKGEQDKGEKDKGEQDKGEKGN